MSLVILIGHVRQVGEKSILNIRVEGHTIYLCYETYDEALYFQEIYRTLVKLNIIPDEIKEEYNRRVFTMATGNEAGRVSQD